MIPWTVAHQIPLEFLLILSMELPRQEHWSGLTCLPPGDLPWDFSDPAIKPGTPALQADSLPSDPPGKPKECVFVNLFVHSTNVYCVKFVSQQILRFVCFFLFCFVFLVSERITSKVLEKRGHHALLTWNPKEWLRLTSTRESNHFQDHFFELKLNTIATLLPISKYVHLCNIVFRVSSVKSNDNILIAQ